MSAYKKVKIVQCLYGSKNGVLNKVAISSCLLTRVFIKRALPVFIFRLEFGTAAQPPATPQSGAEKPVTPTGERREYSH